jgi:hypothetical protein
MEGVATVVATDNVVSTLPGFGTITGEDEIEQVAPVGQPDKTLTLTLLL